ncbi:MAG: ParB/RepB/Spo0J family partition protein, partial [Lactobacillus sp.]|nr:ParB/RepB/Spo0J family partition protein [Lactobacillus sp.]
MLEENKTKKKSLGRGLGALLGDSEISFENIEQAAANKTTTEISVDLITPSEFQPRTEFDAEALKALSQSIKEKGVLQPLLVRRIESGYELIAGERRWRAAKMAGLKEVPVIEKDFTDSEALEVALVENLLRENLSAIEEAEGFQRLMNEFSYTQEALGNVVSKSRSHIANMLRLLNLPTSVQQYVR